mgnify:CR=1 FL=1
MRMRCPNTWGWGSAVSWADTDWTESATAVYNTSKNVGIGTTNPKATLHIDSVSSQWGILITGDGDANNTYAGLYLSDVGGSSNEKWGVVHKKRIGAVEESDFQIVNMPDAAWRVDLAIDSVTGNIGIGTTSPWAKLEVGGNVKISGSVTANSFIYSSDASLKDDIYTLSNQRLGIDVMGMDYDQQIREIDLKKSQIEA